MKALVTGGAGFIGSHLVEKLLQEGHEVIALDNLSRGRMSNLASCMKHPQFHFQESDICDPSALHFDGIDWVFHLAGLADIVPSIEQPRDYFEVNVQGTFNVLDAAQRAGVKKFLYAASSSSYGIVKEIPTPETAPIAPEYPYALTKYLGEELVMHWGKVYKMPVVSLRLFNVYGPRSRTSGTYGAVFGVFLAQKIHKKPFTVVGDGTQLRDFTFVTDVAAAFYEAATSDCGAEIFNVGSGAPQSVNRLVELLQGEVVFIPKRPGEPAATHADVAKIEKVLGWKAKMSFGAGVKEILRHLDDYKEAPVWDSESIHEATKSWFKHLSKEEKDVFETT